MTDTSMILWAQQYATPVLTNFFTAITSLGALEYYMIAIPLFYWLLDKHFGFRFAVFFTLSAYTNSGTKHIFMTERPPHNLRLVTQEGYSFPSGHAQGSTAFWGFAALHIRKRWATTAALLMIALISFSRIYLGVHWPIDILGGLFIGGVLLYLYSRIPQFSAERIPYLTWVLSSAAAAIFLFAIHPEGDGPMTTGFLVGALLGYRTEIEYVNFQEKASLLQNILKVILGLGIFFGLRIVLKPFVSWLPGSLGTFVRYGLMGLWASLGAPYLFMKLGLLKEQPQSFQA